MPLVPVSDLTAADWLTGADEPWGRLVTMGPAGYAAYARLRFIPDPEHPGQQEADRERPDGSPSDIEQLRMAATVLTRHTRSPDDAWHCLWDGWGPALPPEVLAGPRVQLPNRDFFLFRGPLAELGEWPEADGRTGPPRDDLPPAFVWPQDRAWCLTCDVDPHWAGIGASEEAVEELVAHPRLDVVVVDPAADQPFYY